MSSESDKKTYSGADLQETGKKLYLNAKTADVHFSFVADDAKRVKRVPAHKNILAAASDVFEAMFYGKMREKGDVQVTDASEAAFMEFLQFFYLTEATLTLDNIAGVMHLGHKYNVPNCLNACVAFLKDVLSVDNIFTGLNLGILYDQHVLIKSCTTFITLNTTEMFKSIGFMDCDRQALAHILRIDVFSCTEVEVFEACMAWVQAKIKKKSLTKAMVKKHLGDLFHEIRFKSMSVQELCALQTEYEPVLRGDFAVITKMIANPEFQAENFNNQLRQAEWDADEIVECDRTSNRDEECSFFTLTTQTTTFSSDVPLLLGSFVCSKIIFFGSYYRDLTSDLSVDVEIIEDCDPNDENTDCSLILTMKAKLQSKNVNHIHLPHPVLIRPGFFYTISIGPFPDKHVYFSENLKTKLYFDVAKAISDKEYVQFHNCSKIGARTFELISSLYFNKLE